MRYHQKTVEQSPSVFLVILLGLLAGSANLVGGLFAVSRPVLTARRRMLALAFSGGFLLSVAVINILPEALESSPHAPFLVLGGYFLVYLSEHLFAGHAHHSHHERPGGHRLIGVLPCSEAHNPIQPGAAVAATTGLGVHSFFDGAAITAGLFTGTPLGWLTFFAVLLHKLPEGFSQASITLASRCSRGQATASAGILGLSSVLGSLATLVAVRFTGGMEGVILSVACGMFLHISATDLLPVTARVRGMAVLLTTALGFASAILASLALHRFLPIH